MVSISIKRFFVRAKHWQIFLLLIGPCLIAQLALANSIATPMASVEDFDRTARILGAFTLAVMVCLMGWFWSVGSLLTSVIPEQQRLPLLRLRLSLIYPAVYITYFFATLSVSSPPSALIIPFHLLAMFCMFYNLYFISKSLVLAETDKAAGFYEYSGPFFLIWFFPIGLWIIQPRINRLAERS